MTRYLNFGSFAVEDGTGVVQVNYKLEQYMSQLKQRQAIDEKYRRRAEDLRSGGEAEAGKHHPKKFPETRPKFCYPRDASQQNVAVRV